MDALAMRVLSERYACIDVVLQSTAIVVRRLGFFFFFVAARAWSLLPTLLRIGMDDLVDRSLSYLVRIRCSIFVLRASLFPTRTRYIFLSFTLGPSLRRSSTPKFCASWHGGCGEVLMIMIE